MYNKYFGFREKPFKLVPNPEYLYLSKCHEIALAHLSYAADQGDGFVVITGEVGTGKTTLCRNFLEQLDDDTESAYIFNPQLNPTQLLTSICNEYGILTEQQNLKELLDELNQYLIAKNQAKCKVVLLIDEAQNLTVENLEMVRLLSNLETTRNKLLQIILVGQPELGDNLDTHELRQLAQRISLNAHLTPISASETQGYIQHRINIAAQRQTSLFTPGACRSVYNYSNGIPRLINIACDRALLVAYSLNRPKVSSSIVKAAIKELSSRGHVAKRRLGWPKWAWVGLVLVVILLAGFLVVNTRLMDPLRRPAPIAVPPTAPAAVVKKVPPPPQVKETIKIPAIPKPDTQVAKDPPPVANTQLPTPPESPVAPKPSPITALIGTLERGPARLDALTVLLAQWQQPAPNQAQLPSIVDDAAFFDIAAHQYGLRIYTLVRDWALVQRLNLPAIVTLKRPNQGQVVHMALIGWQNGQIHLSNGHSHQEIYTSLEAIKPHAQGPIHIFWKNVLGFDAIISQGANSRAVFSVKNLLRQIGYEKIDPGPLFGPSTEWAVRDFQTHHQIKPDGLVGPLTKILLIKQAGAYESPRLNPDKRIGG